MKELINEPKKKLISVDELKDTVKDVELNSVKAAVDEFENEIEKDREK